MSIHGPGNSLVKAYSNAGASQVAELARSKNLNNPPAVDNPNAENSATAASSSVVTISDSAKAAAAQADSEPSFTDVGTAARAKLDILKQQGAEKTGITAGAVNLNHVDYSSFSDQDLAAMNLNPSGNFSKNEQIQAAGVLNERLRVSLETYRAVTELGDRRGHTMTIKALYAQMTPEVRSAMGWTPTMMQATDYLLALDEGKFGRLPVAGMLLNLQTTQAEGGIGFDPRRFREGDLAIGEDRRI